MNDSCWCDYDAPELYLHSSPIARKERCCSECGKTIHIGEKYEHVFGKWDGQIGQFNTCCRCLSLKEFITAHVPCYCFEHGNIIEGCIEEAREYAHETVGLIFGALRRLVLIRRNK